MEKKLKSYTIIPNNLYVERSADIQLRGIVEDMGRPGYVLVSRQMGKTNLLLNAKRNLEDSDHIFIYADLSNNFPNIEQFFRHIIDIALATNPEKFKDVESKIYELREKKRNLPAHREHEQELRLLLQCVVGKIVICLDEIDALTNSIYSDSVFSLIRSTYFSSRVNFSEFNRLTYILSGVAEPNEIIKNKNISPFNIGEKIYLDDFSYVEFEEFLKKSGLCLDVKNSERIFYWANGNPRICWDICSAIEDIIIAGKELNPSVIDKTVQKLYLTEFDMAPIDHIRKIVEDDQDLRSAVINIHFGKFESISDLQRNKLYLSGIIKSDYSDEFISIKNRVIESSLNENWIREIENSKLSLRELASSKFNEGNYFEALELLIKHEKNGISLADAQPLFHEMARCCMLIGDYERVIEYIFKNPFKKSGFTSLYYTQNQWLGTAYYRLGKLDESIECFEKVINSDFEEDGYPLTYFECQVNVSSVYSTKFNESDPRILEYNKNVISNEEHIRSIASNAEVANSIILAACHNFAKAKRSSGLLAEAAISWKKAISIAKENELPKFISELITVSKDATEKMEHLRSVVNLIRSKNLMPASLSVQNPFIFSFSVYSELIFLAYKINDEKSKLSLIKYLCSLDSPDYVAWKTLRVAATKIIGDGNYHIGAEIFKIAIELPKEKVIENERLGVLRYILLGDKYGLFRKYEDEFLKYLIDSRGGISDFDIKIVYDIIDRHLDRKRVLQARKIFEKFIYLKYVIGKENLKEKNLEEDFSFIVMDYVELRILVAEKNKSAADEKARYIKNLIASDVSIPDFFSDNMLKVIEGDADYVLDIYIAPVQASGKFKKYGRNDIVIVRYKDGSEKSGKFKTFESDVLSNECIVK